MASFPTVDESLARLHRAGWSVGDVRILTAQGPHGLVAVRASREITRCLGREHLGSSIGS